MSDAYRFWRPTILAVIICVIVGVACHFALNVPVADGQFSNSDLMGLKLPAPALTAREVVQIQMEGLTDPNRRELGIFQCYCFASPANRIVTGPFQRFANMVSIPPYDFLRDSLKYSIGESRFVGNDEQRILVSAIGPDHELQVYGFVLGLQKEGPFEGCWMTGAVFHLMGGTTPERGPSADSDLEA